MTATAKRQIGIRIPQELDKRLEEHVSKIGISKAAFILSILYRELEATAHKNNSDARANKD